MHSWSCIHMGDRPLHRTIWEDRKAIFGHLISNPLKNHAAETGKWLITQPKIRPNHVPFPNHMPAQDYLLRHGHPTSLGHTSVVLSRRPPIPIGDYSPCHSRIWTRSHLPFKTLSWNGHLLTTFPHGTLEQSNCPPMHQSLQQTPPPA